MGQVYRATDTRLNRTVAVKVLSQALADDPLFRERFDHEAQAVAGLAHPSICALYDVGCEHLETESGAQQAVNFLVLEYLEGETLAARLERGAIPVDHALPLAIQMADALDAAHRRGIVGIYERSSGLLEAPNRVIGDPDGASYQVDSWSRDGRFLIYSVGPFGRVWILPLEGDRRPIAFMQNAGGATLAQFSPDGRWIAYQSRISGRNEIYVAPFPGRPGKVTTISNAGGGWPRWSRAGKELFSSAPISR